MLSALSREEMEAKIIATAIIVGMLCLLLASVGVTADASAEKIYGTWGGETLQEDDDKFFMATIGEWDSKEERKLYEKLEKLDDARLHVPMGKKLSEGSFELIDSQQTDMKGAEFFTIKDLTKNLPELKKRGYDYVDYNIEKEANGRPNPDFANFLGNILRFADIAHENGFKAHVSPAQWKLRQLSDGDFEKIAKAVDRMHFQFQTVQHKEGEFKEFVKKYPEKARRVNPDIETTVQLTTSRNNPSLDLFKDRWNDAKPHVDGVTLWMNDSGPAKKLLQDFLAWFDSSGR